MLQHRIYIPAGGRPMSTDDPRPEWTGKQDWYHLPEAVEAASKGVTFGLNIVGPEKLPSDFDPVLLGVPYGMHAANESLTQLYAAHRKGDQEAQTAFWKRLELWASLSPAPEYVTFHLGGTGIIPKQLDRDRFNVIQPIGEIEVHLSWLRDTFRRILQILPSASPENIGKDQFVGPPQWDLGGEWLGMTYQEDRRGIGPDIAYILADTQGRATFDVEHWFFSSQALDGTALEYQGLEMPRVWDLSQGGEEIYRYTGLLYVQGKPVGVPIPIGMDQMISDLRPKVLHVGGIHPAVIEVAADEADNPYHHHLQQILPQDIWEQVRLRRVGSHASISEDDKMLKDSVITAIRCGAEISVPEVASFGEAAPKDGSSPGCWYWQPKDALKESFLAYCRMLPALIAAAQA
ncbi:MAG: hypothetical protein HW405_618 [Candidatus Berkelbacteria bacterium]|nr:hypothetical protein [Candidatus Berkelbacteria bacterium]